MRQPKLRPCVLEQAHVSHHRTGRDASAAVPSDVAAGRGSLLDNIRVFGYTNMHRQHPHVARDSSMLSRQATQACHEKKGGCCMNSLWMSVQFFVLIFAELTALFLGISTLVGLALQYVSDEKLRAWLSRRGLFGNFLGALLGAITPFCSCSTIPMTVGLLRAGVPFGATMSFVLASPLLNPIILTMFWALLGWKACVVYGVVTFVASVLSGALLQALGFAKDVKRVRVSGAEDRVILPTFRMKLRHAFSGAWGDFRGVLVFLVIGVAIGAAIYGYLPNDFIVRIAGPHNPLAIPVAAIIGIPLYVRAETVIPIAVALTQKGMSMGAVLALIIGGAGMSIPEMSMLAAIFKLRLVSVFVGVVFITAVSAGLVFNVM